MTDAPRTYPSEPRPVAVAGHNLGFLIEVGDSVTALTKGTWPIQVHDSDIKLVTYEARQVAELLLRPNAREIGAQLLLAAQMVEDARDGG